MPAYYKVTNAELTCVIPSVHWKEWLFFKNKNKIFLQKAETTKKFLNVCHALTIKDRSLSSEKLQICMCLI